MLTRIGFSNSPLALTIGSVARPPCSEAEGVGRMRAGASGDRSRRRQSQTARRLTHDVDEIARRVGAAEQSEREDRGLSHLDARITDARANRDQRGT